MPDRPQTASRPDNLRGTYAAPCAACSGTAHVIRTVDELPRFREGEILVATSLGADWHRQILLARAIVLEEAACAIPEPFQSELPIPVLLGVAGAIEAIRSGDIISLDEAGTIRWMRNRRAPDSPMRVSVPAAVEARGLAGHEAVANVLQFPMGAGVSGVAEARDAQVQKTG